MHDATRKLNIAALAFYCTIPASFSFAVWDVFMDHEISIGMKLVFTATVIAFACIWIIPYIVYWVLVNQPTYGGCLRFMFVAFHMYFLMLTIINIVFLATNDQRVKNVSDTIYMNLGLAAGMHWMWCIDELDRIKRDESRKTNAAPDA